MPGRFGKGKEMLLLPMDFHEYKTMRKAAKWQEIPLLECLRHYYRCGGFPSAVIESDSAATIPIQAMDTYRRWLVSDAVKLGRQELYLREILAQVAITNGTPISLQKLAQRTQIGSHHTALEYIALLEDCFALRTCYAIDPNTGAYRFRKEKNLFFRSPYLSHCS